MRNEMSVSVSREDNYKLLFQSHLSARARMIGTNWIFSIWDKYFNWWDQPNKLHHTRLLKLVENWICAPN